jgi:hypothetical protein
MKSHLPGKNARDERAERRTGPGEFQAERTTAGAQSPAPWHSAEATTPFVYLGVVVAANTIYRLSGLGKRTAMLGPLTGATAGVTGGTSRRTLPRALTAVGALSKKPSAAAFVVTAGGELARHKLDGAIPVRRAQAQTIQFNALVRRSALSHESGT